MTGGASRQAVSIVRAEAGFVDYAYAQQSSPWLATAPLLAPVSAASATFGTVAALRPPPRD